MRHRHGMRKLNMDSSQRKATFRNMVTSLVLHERIKTTEAKAKELRRYAERVITIARLAPNRTVVLTGDIHTHWMNELHEDFSRPDRPVVAAEFVTTSISSGGDGSETPGENATKLNPHVKWHANRRGYITCLVEPERWTAEYRTVPFITRPDAPIETPARFRLTRGRPGVEQI